MASSPARTAGSDVCGTARSEEKEVITMDKQKTTAILYALLAAVFYAINVPISKILLKDHRRGIGTRMSSLIA